MSSNTVYICILVVIANQMVFLSADPLGLGGLGSLLGPLAAAVGGENAAPGSVQDPKGPHSHDGGAAKPSKATGQEEEEEEEEEE